MAGKKNRYEGKVKFVVDGRTEEELGHEYLSLLITDGFIQGMFDLHKKGIMDFGLDGWEYHGLVRPE